MQLSLKPARTSAIFYAQLASNGSIDDVFALCFGSVEGEGALMLGDADVAGRFNVDLQYTPLLANPAHPHYYSVALEALVVGGEKLDVRPVRPGFLWLGWPYRVWFVTAEAVGEQ